MKQRKHNRGFTMAELMLAVGILTVLFGVSTVGVAHYMRLLTGTEMDTVAREIYIAAQNHLTMAEGQGFLGLSESEMGIPESGTPGAFYFVSGSGGTARLQNLLLPTASLDESVRAGSYVIYYQTHPAQVLDVFYAEPSGRYPHEFAASEFQDLLTGYRGTDKGGSRRDYLDRSVIGWYGVGSEPSPILQGTPLEAPVVELINAERLEAVVYNPNAAVAKAGLRLIVTGCSSGGEKVIDLIDSGGASSPGYSLDPNSQSEKERFRFVLDDITSPSGHFYSVFGGESRMIPGEDITVRAVSYNNHEFTNIAASSGVTTNSLFAFLNTDGENNATAVIANFRHLENLDPNISGIGVSGDKSRYEFVCAPEPGQAFGAAVHLTRAEQSGDMDWNVFQARIRELRGEIVEDGAQSESDVQIFRLDGTSSAAGCYYPVRNGGALAYSGTTAAGRAGVIRNVKVSVSGTAGLFSTLKNASVSNLELVDFDITSKDRCAGALAGSLENASVRNVLARNEEGGAAVWGSLAAGGLVGELSGAGPAPALSGCAAAVLVASDGDAGGLVGRATDSAAFSGCYAGGRTDIAAQTEDGFVKHGGYDPTKYNVTGGGAAGGLIGSVSGQLTAAACYATCSVSGGGAAGGLFGSAAGGRVTDCYCTGLVGGAAARGAFAGSAGGAAFSGCSYLAIVNETADETGGIDLDPVGGTKTVAGLTAFDDTVASYEAFAGEGGDARPYDGALLGQSEYPFRTVGELPAFAAEGGAPAWAGVHYGDWPVPGTQTINVTG